MGLLGGVGGLELEELLDEGDLGEVVVPHADAAAADVGVVAVVVGEAGELVERGLDVGGGEPIFAAAGGGHRGEELDLGDPGATAFVAEEEPVAGVVGRGVGGAESVGGESSVGVEVGDGEIEIGHELGVGGKKLRGDFAMAGDDEISVGVDWGVRNFMVEVAAELAGGFCAVIGGLGIVGFGGAGEEEIGVGDGDSERVLFEACEGGLQGDGENDGALVIALAVELDAVAVESADVIGEVTPEAGEFVAVETADFEVGLGGDVGDTRGGGVRGGEDGGEVDGAAVEDDLVLGVEAGAEETADGEGVILAVLAPGVAVDDGEGEDLLAAVGREQGIERLRGDDFAIGDGFGLGGLLLLFGLFLGEFGGDERLRGRCCARQCLGAFGLFRAFRSCGR